MTKPTNETMKKFKESFLFLNDHPAMASGGFTPFGDIFPYYSAPFEMCIYESCKNNHYLDNAPPYISLNKDDKRFSEFLGRVGEKAVSKGLKVGVKGDKDMLEVDYSLYYGYPWEMDHYDIILESGYRRFILSDAHSDKPRWNSWHDYENDVSAPSYEEAVIALASKLRKEYGDFSSLNIVPEHVKNYNNSIMHFTDKVNDGDIMAFFNSPLRNCTVRVTDAEKNEMWWQTFAKENEISEDHDSKFLDVSHLLDEDKFNKFSINTLSQCKDAKLVSEFKEYLKSI